MSNSKPKESVAGRAQSGFAVASGITSLVVAAGLFTGIGDRAHEARYLAAGALAVWLVTMFLFLRATEAARDRQAKSYRFGSPMLHAVLSAGAATAVTIAAFILITATSLSVDLDDGIMQVNGDGKMALTELCPIHRGSLVPGRLEVPSLKENFVVFTISRGWCFPKDSATVKLPRADVLAFLEDKEGSLTPADTIAGK